MTTCEMFCTRPLAEGGDADRILATGRMEIPAPVAARFAALTGRPCPDSGGFTESALAMLRGDAA